MAQQTSRMIWQFGIMVDFERLFIYPKIFEKGVEFGELHQRIPEDIDKLPAALLAFFIPSICH
jgi:hypothetical protein